jgi:glucoamylase
MPLVWAHAEYIKLRRSLRDGRVFDLPVQTVQRYVASKNESPFAVWRFNHKSRTIPAGKTLRVELLSPGAVRWSSDGGKTSDLVTARDTSLGVYTADLSTRPLPAGSEIAFSIGPPDLDHGGGENFQVVVTGPIP